MNKVYTPSYLIKNSYTFCFRMAVPDDLQDIVFKKELRYSLKTGNLLKAKNKARFIAGQVQMLFRDVRKGRYTEMD
jgi:hypothetical protein